MLTADADTITDEQIHELDRERAIDHDTIEDALSTTIHHVLRRDARGRCARILNARVVLVDASTVTDEQIDKLWGALTKNESAGASVHGVRECIIALRLPDDPPTGEEVARARAVCAEIINARATGAKLACSRCSGPVHRSDDHLRIGEAGESWTCAR